MTCVCVFSTDIFEVFGPPVSLRVATVRLNAWWNRHQTPKTPPRSWPKIQNPCLKPSPGPYHKVTLALHHIHSYSTPALPTPRAHSRRRTYNP